MTTVTRRRRRHRPLAALAVLAVLLVPACTSDDPPADPEQALVQVVRDTLDDDFAYRLVAEADREALAALGRDLGSVAARLNLFEVSGVTAGGAVTVDVQVVGTDPLFQLRRAADDTVHLRVAAGDGPLGALATPELEGRVLAVAVQTGQSDAVVAAIGALFAGEWIEVGGGFDGSVLDALGDRDEPADEADTPGTSTPLPDVVADYLVVTDRTEDDGTTTLRVDLRIRDLLRALSRLGGDLDAAAVEDGLEALPQVVTGDVVTRDDRVERIVFDVAEGARQAGDDVPGRLELRLELSDHGDVALPPAPEAEVVVPGEDLAEGLAQLLATPPPAPTESATPAAP
jgi:hypothetical protein